MHSYWYRRTSTTVVVAVVLKQEMDLLLLKDKSEPSEHPHDQGGKLSKSLGRTIDRLQRQKKRIYKQA